MVYQKSKISLTFPAFQSLTSSLYISIIHFKRLRRKIRDEQIDNLNGLCEEFERQKEEENENEIPQDQDDLDDDLNWEERREIETMQRVKEYILEQSRIKNESSSEELAPPNPQTSDKPEKQETNTKADIQSAGFLNESKYACSPRNSSDEEVEDLFFSELSQLFSRTRIAGLPPIPTIPTRAEREVIVESKLDEFLLKI